MAGNNIFLCVLFSACTGLCFAISGAIPAWYAAKDREVEEYNKTITKNKEEKNHGNSLRVKRQDTVKEDEEEQGEEFLPEKEGEEFMLKDKTSPCTWKIASIASALIQLVGCFLFNYLAVLFGPVSICTPVISCSVLIFNVILISYILKIEAKPNKETRVGNYLILAAVVLVVFTGPIVDDIEPLTKEELQNQLLAPASATLIIVMMVIFVLTLPHTAIVMFHKKGGNYFSDSVNFVVFQASILIMGSLSGSCLKVFSNSEGWFFWLNNIVFCVCFLLFPVVSVYQNIVIKNPATFASINQGFTYLLSVIVGLICWKDQIRNWGGYVISWTMFILGIYLVSDLDLLGTEDSNDDDDIDLSLIAADAEVDKISQKKSAPLISRLSVVPGTRVETTVRKAERNSMLRFSMAQRSDPLPNRKEEAVHDDDVSGLSSVSRFPISNPSFNMKEGGL